MKDQTLTPLATCQCVWKVCCYMYTGVLIRFFPTHELIIITIKAHITFMISIFGRIVLVGPCGVYKTFNLIIIRQKVPASIVTVTKLDNFTN